MNLLITAGTTRSPIDRIRGVTTIFTGRTGSKIATTAWNRGHTVTLVTSNPRELPDIPPASELSERRLNTILYTTHDDLTTILQREIKSKAHAVIIHTAASSDYTIAGTFAPDTGTFFNPRNRTWGSNTQPLMIEQSTEQIQGIEPELWVRMVRAPRLVDRFRNPWGFGGLIVRFTVEPTMTDAELRGTADFARKQSGASLIVATTIDSVKHWAIMGPVDGKYERVSRREVPERLVEQIEHLRQTGQGSWHDG
jgi:phosphopantothenate---cysteine ligase (CTP)